MDRYKTQKDKILHHLNTHGGITPKEALFQYGCMRLSAQILNIKEDGVRIVTLIRQEGDAHFAEYWLEERFKKEHDQAVNFNLANSGSNMPIPKPYFMKDRKQYGQEV
tara:strand:- start:271 stop:594 length:324 start_codon:yes stop_codon:yes gene_type:complete